MSWLRRLFTPKYDPLDDMKSIQFSRSHQKKLIRSIGMTPFQKQFGRGLCPFCIHLEARWRREDEPETNGSFVVRVRCSQCQKGLIYELRPDGSSEARDVLPDEL